MAHKKTGRDVSNGIKWSDKHNSFVIKVGSRLQPIDYRENDGSPVSPVKEK